MKSFLLILVGFVAGALLSFFVAGGVMAGVGAGVGIVTGLKAGACLTVEAAKEKGFVTADQVDEVLQAAAGQFGTVAEEDASFSGGDAECQKVVADLKAAAADAQE